MSPRPDIPDDSSHFHRTPVRLTSLAEAYAEGSAERAYYEWLKRGLEVQFYDVVLCPPSPDFPSYHTRNFMDGWNGIYRYTYSSTTGEYGGYGPFDLSGTMLLGWWSLLDTGRMRDVYRSLSESFPLSDEVVQLYVDENTTREQNPFVRFPDAPRNGFLELVVTLAGQRTIEAAGPNGWPLTMDSSVVTVTEGELATNTGAYFDYGDSIGTLTASVGTVVDNGDGTWNWCFATNDGPAQSQTVTITIQDSTGDHRSIGFQLVVVDTTTPTVTITGPSDGFQGVPGQSRTFAFAASDPNGTDGPFTYRIDWGDGQIQTVTDQAGSNDLVPHTFVLAGTYTITAAATDKDGMTGPVFHGLTATILVAEQQGRNVLVGGTQETDVFTLTRGTASGTVSVIVNGAPAMDFVVGAYGSVQILGQGGGDVVTINGTDGADTLLVTLTGVKANSNVSITTTSLAGGEVNVAYSQTVAVAGGAAPFTWSVAAGVLPGGLTLDPATGAISGTPTVVGTFNFLAQAQDSLGGVATQPLSIAVAPAMAIATTALPGGQVGMPYSQTLFAAGGSGQCTWGVSAGALPNGLTMDAATGTISGKPTLAGTCNFTAWARDTLGGNAWQPLSIVVAARPSFATTALPNGEAGVAYSQALVVTGGTAPFTWSVLAGSLPIGVALNPTTGVLSGTPMFAGTFNFLAMAEDAQGATAFQPRSVVVATAPSITTTTLPDGTFGAAYSQTLAATGGTTPYTWSVSASALPGGLTLDPATGVISGTVTATGTFNFTVGLADGMGAVTTQPLSIAVPAGPTISTTALAGGEVGVAYSQPVVATGGTTSNAWSVSAGVLPGGLRLDPATGIISGSPTTAGTFDFTVSVQDANAFVATQNLSIAVAARVSITTTALPNGEVGAAYSRALAAAAGTTPFTWSISGGALPAGLTLGPATGVISGTPTASGTSNFTVRVVDAFGVAATRNLSLAISSPVSVATANLPSARINRAYNRSLSASKGVAPYAWSLVGGALPTGLTLSSAGVISGTPTVSGLFNFTVQVRDSYGVTATRALSLRVWSF